MKKNNLLFIAIPAALMNLFSACNDSGEPVISDDIAVEDYVDLNFNCQIGNNLNSRCVNVTTSGGDLDDDTCLTNNYKMVYKIVISYDNKIIECQNLVYYDETDRTYKTGDITDSKYFTFIKQKDDLNINFGLRFLSNLDPSKIEIFCIANRAFFGYNENLLINADIGNNSSQLAVRISGNNMRNYCYFFDLIKLATQNEWNDITTTLNLRRLNAEIVILTKNQLRYINNQMFNFRDNGTVINGKIYLTSVFNWKPSVDHLQSISRWNYSTNGQSELQYYYPFIDKSEFNEESHDFNWQSNAYLSLNDLDNNYNVVYKNTKYKYLSGLEIISDKKNTLPSTIQGNPIKYLTLLAGCEVSTEGKYYYWTNIAIPPEGFKANKRYIIILGDSFKWDNNGESTNTRSSENSPNDMDKPFTDYELIAMDLDEPFPFEIEETDDSL